MIDKSSDATFFQIVSLINCITQIRGCNLDGVDLIQPDIGKVG